ncbi:4Fe-4S dicluster domain-containing protein [Chloroflexota bacterium]
MAAKNKENTQETGFYDERDTFLSRAALVPGTREYEEYYAKHPEWEEMDNELKTYSKDQVSHERRLKRFPKKQIPEAWVRSPERFIMSILLREAVDGPVRHEKVEVDPSEITWKIKGFAKYLGAGIVGVASLKRAWVYSHGGNLNVGNWGKPIKEHGKYAIVMGFPQDWDLWLASGQNGIAATMDTAHYYNLMAAAAVRLAASIRSMGYAARAQISTNYTCVLPPLAVDAGLGEQCLVGICLTRKYGLAYRLCAVTTDLPLVPDSPVNLGIEDFCSKCTKCADACPVGAISSREKIGTNGIRRWKQDLYKCLRYWNAIGASCTLCRRACPWSKPQTLLHKSVANLAIHAPFLRSLLIRADDLFYGKQPKYYSPPDWLRGED